MNMQQTRAEVGERAKNTRQIWRDTLALFVGAGRRHQVEEVASAIGVGADTIRRYLRGESCPEWENAVAIMAVLPVEFAAAVLRPAGLTGLRRIDGDCTANETMSDVAQATAVLAAALVDGRIDHTEWPKVRRDLTKAMAGISQFLATEGTGQ